MNKLFSHILIAVVSIAVTCLLFTTTCKREEIAVDHKKENRADSLLQVVKKNNEALLKIREAQFALSLKTSEVKKEAAKLPSVKQLVKPDTTLHKQSKAEVIQDYDVLKELAKDKEKLLDISIALGDSTHKNIEAYNKLEAQNDSACIDALRNKDAIIEDKDKLIAEEKAKGKKNLWKGIKRGAIAVAVLVGGIWLFGKNNAL